MNSEQKKEYMKKWRAEHPEYSRYMSRKWRAEHPEYYKKYNKNRIPEKKHARNYIRNRIVSGYINKSNVCEGCGEEEYNYNPNKLINAHHYMGYVNENKDNVLWLCRSCDITAHQVKIK